MRKALVVGALVVCAAGIAVAVASAGGRGPRLSDSYVAAAKAPCERFNTAVEPFLVGAGFEDLIRQIDAFSAARAKLSSELTALATDGSDRKRLEPLLRKLADGNRLLSAARTAAGEHRFESAYGRLDQFGRVSDAQDKLVARLGIAPCG